MSALMAYSAREGRLPMQVRSVHFRIPLANREIFITYPGETPGRFFEIDKYPDGTTQLWLGRLWALSSPLRTP
jgi:hypothetical protein